MMDGSGAPWFGFEYSATAVIADNVWTFDSQLHSVEAARGMRARSVFWQTVATGFRRCDTKTPEIFLYRSQHSARSWSQGLQFASRLPSRGAHAR